MGTETASVLFTDVVGSTALLARLGGQRGDAFRRRHDELMARSVEDAGGRVVKHLGDGVMAVFGAAADALEAAVHIQQEVDQHGRAKPDEAFAVRVGVSVGDVTAEEDGDLHGTAVVEASRLCDAAQGGQILVADLVRAMARGRAGVTYESVGALELKGLSAPVAACSVGWEPVSERADLEVPFPPLLAPPTAVAYAGRHALRMQLGDLRRAVGAGAGARVVLLVGEPGVGKTRTASELARAAHRDGTMVLYGRCDEELALPYQPFVEALDWQTAHAPELPLGRFPGDLRRLVPDLDGRVPDLPPAITSDAGTEEHRLHEAVASWLAHVSRDGLVLVVDDMHWATRPTLQLLLHVARAVMPDPDARLLLVGTYRDTEVDRRNPLSPALADLRVLPSVERVPVDPLTEDEVLELVQEAAGHELDDGTRALARRAYRETEGNPFFVGEVLRYFIETGAVRFVEGRWIAEEPDRIDVPEGVRDVVGRRLDRLSEAADDVLSAAAVIGREFTLDVLGHVAGLHTDAIVDVLDESLRARLVDELGPDRFRFSHAITRRTLYEELSSTRRRRMHHQVVEALEANRPDDVSALAHHSVEAGPIGGDLGPAIRYSLAAGDRALAGRATADAARHLSQVLELLEDVREPERYRAEERRARCGLGEAQRDSGDPEFRQTLSQVTRDALDAGDREVAVRSVLGNGRVITSLVGGVDEARVAQVEAVRERFGDEVEDRERARLLATLASELSGALDQVERRVELVAEAERLIADVSDPALQANVLVVSNNALAIPSRVGELPARMGRAVALADAAGDPVLRVVTRLNEGYSLSVAGDQFGARRAFTESRDIAEAEATPTMRWLAQGFWNQLSAWDGDIATSRANNQASFEVALQLEEPDALSWWGGLEMGLRWSEGSLPEVAETLHTMVAESPDVLGWRMTHAYALADGGDRQAARRAVERHQLDRADRVTPQMFSLPTWCVQVWLLDALGDRSALAALDGVLRPHRGRWGSTGVFVYQPVALANACCAVAAGDVGGAVDLARSGWEDLLAAGVRVSMPAAAVTTVPALIRTGVPEAIDLAVSMVDRGLDEARTMGMDRRRQQLESLSERARSVR